ncbi:MAG: FecR domain-containing protein, partial [Deltaproteobacteria bacterium]|nr:FecR domain-containing protein [Deltaproteobacteria bacterium]
MSRIDELGRRVAAEQDRILDGRDDLALVRRRLEHGDPPPARKDRRPWLAAAAALAVAAAAGLVYAIAAGAGDHAASPATAPDWTLGGWITAPEGAAVPIRFADGSVLRLEPRGEACVLAADAADTRVALRRGAAEVEVVHRPAARWVVEAGPFSVQVTGTRFRAAWDPDAESFELALTRGRVVVDGPLLAAGRPLVEGDVLRVWVTERRVELIANGERVARVAPEPTRPVPKPCPPIAPPAPPVVTVVPVETPACPPPDPGATAAPPRTPAPRAPEDAATPPAAHEDAWRTLARVGRYDEAVAAAEQVGFEPLVAGAPAVDLLALGDAARLAGRADRA